MNKKALNASLLEKMLILSVVALLGITIAVYILLSNFTRTQAVSANHSAITAESSQKDIDSLQKSYDWTKANSETVDKTNKIVAQASQYKYQDQAIKDIEAITNQAGIKVLKYTFSEASAGATTSPATAPSSAPATSGGAVSTGSGVPSGLVQTFIGIDLAGGIHYDKLLLFIKKIEQNVTRMQITSLSLKPDEKDASQITLDKLNISVLINKGQ